MNDLANKIAHLESLRPEEDAASWHAVGQTLCARGLEATVQKTCASPATAEMCG